MSDIQKQDMRLFVKELFHPGRIILLFFVSACFAMWVSSTRYQSHWLTGFILFGLYGVLSAATAYNASKQKRFHSKRFEAMWGGCKDRLARFDDVLGKMRREQIADLSEMPKTIRRVGDNLYLALRRADMITVEVNKTEKDMYGGPPIWQSPSNDPQAKELYRIADKNIAEYRQQFAGVMAGVHRAEAQSAVFMTTLDSLRMKMIGYRLVGKNPEMSSQDFLEALGEAKLQLHAIDQALDELDFSQMPQMIAVVPPPVPEELRQSH